MTASEDHPELETQDRHARVAIAAGRHPNKVGEACIKALADIDHLRQQMDQGARHCRQIAASLREWGDYAQVLMDESGVAPALTVADELECISICMVGLVYDTPEVPR